MSAASRAREEAQKVLSPKFEDDATPDADDIAGQVITWDFERLVAGFVEHQDLIADEMGVKSVAVTEKGLEVVQRPVFVGTIRYDKQRQA